MRFKKRTWIAVGIAIVALVGFANDEFVRSKEWERVGTLSDVSGLRSGLEAFLKRDTLFDRHGNEARSALAELAVIDETVQALVGTVRGIIADKGARSSPCAGTTDSRADCSRIPSGDGVVLLDYARIESPTSVTVYATPPRGSARLEDPVPTLATTSTIADLVAKPDYVVFIEQGEQTVGKYTNLGSATRIRWQVYVVDWHHRQLTGETTLLGSEPPSTITRPATGPLSMGVGAGGEPPRAELEVWMRTLNTSQ